MKIGTNNSTPQKVLFERSQLSPLQIKKQEPQSATTFSRAKNKFNSINVSNSNNFTTHRVHDRSPKTATEYRNNFNNIDKFKSQVFVPETQIQNQERLIINNKLNSQTQTQISIGAVEFLTEQKRNPLQGRNINSTTTKGTLTLTRGGERLKTDGNGEKRELNKNRNYVMMDSANIHRKATANQGF